MTSFTAGGGWSGRSIQARVILLVGTGVVAALAILGGTAWTGLNQMADRWSAERVQVARAIAEHVDYLLQADMEVLQGLSALPGIEAAERPPQAPGLRDAYLRSRLAERVLVIAPDGHVLLREPETASATLDGPSTLDLQAALKTGRPAASNLTPGSGQRLLYLLVPLRNWRGEIVAVAAGEIDPAGARLSAILDPFHGSAAGSIDIIDATGNTVASTDRARRLRTRDDAPALVAAIHERRAVVGPGTGADARMTLALAPLTAAPWGDPDPPGRIGGARTGAFPAPYHPVARPAAARPGASLLVGRGAQRSQADRAAHRFRRADRVRQPEPANPRTGTRRNRPAGPIVRTDAHGAQGLAGAR